ncbi:MAG: O-antigen ligase family protein, partial [Dehalococcoidia bacterium]|nr:O-antigen ligase family protein [Dehalococcoidia bacterium]
TTVELIWMLIILLVPLYYNPLERQAFYFAKSLLFQFLIVLMLGIVCGQWFLNVRRSTRVGLVDYIKTSPLQVAVICFGLIWIASTVLSIMPQQSFWGSMARKNGLITEIYWIVFFLIIACKMRSAAQIHRALYTLIISAGIVSVIGLFQFIEPGIFRGYLYTGRPFSTDGNPLSLSAFLAMVIPITLAMIILTSFDNNEARYKKVLKQIGLGAAFIAQVCCLSLAQYSLTLLLYIIGIFVFFTLIGIFLRRRLTLILGAAVLVSIAVIAIILLGQMLNPGQQTATTGGNDSSAPVAEQVGLKTLGMRVLIWQAAADVILKSPEVAFHQDNYHSLRKLIGYGPETFIVTSQAEFPASLRSSATYRAGFLGQPENHYLYLGVTVGILGLISFLSVIVVFLFVSFKLLVRSKRQENILIISAFIGAIAQYCAHMLFNPTAIDPELVFWLIMGLTPVFTKLEIPVSISVQASGNNTLIQRHIIPEDKAKVARRIISALIIVIFAGVALGLTARPLMADITLQKGINLWSKDKGAALNAFYEATIMEPFEASYYGYRGYHLFVKARESEDVNERAALLEASVAAYALANEMEPYLAYWNYTPADVCTYWAKNGAEDKWPRAIYLYESADELFPENAVITNKLALALMLRGDYEAAGQRLEQSQIYDPGWMQTSLFRGLLGIYENGQGSAAESFIAPVRQKIYDIGYFMDFCRQLAIYNEVTPVAQELKLYAGNNPDDWVAQSLWGIASVYAGNITDSQEAFGNMKKIVPVEKINLVINIIRQLAYENKDFSKVSGRVLEEMK